MRLRASLAVLVLMPIAAAAADAASPDAIDFFERRIRPVLADRCYSCHSAEAAKLKGALYVDSRPGLLAGGESGPALVPGDAERSRLIAAIRWTDEDLRMPPKERLPASVVHDFETWIAMGAPDPRATATATATPAGSAGPHWAFQAPRDAPPPSPRDAGRVRTPIDAFVVAALEDAGLALAPPAEPRALLRRAAIDLTGLPPTAEELDAFAADPGADAFARAVDRMLASPRYGERWGRHWLDVARYADTKGDIDGEEERRYPYAYTYRDWVIAALNDDLPYDRFLLEQIAADQLPHDDARPLAALGFLTAGRRFYNRAPDIIDDRIDVLCRGTMALTVGCARCHDHKYDPIPTADYYALYSVFDNSVEPKELPELPAPRTPAVEAYEAELASARAAIAGFTAERHGEVLGRLRSAERIAAYLLAAHDAAAGAAVDELADQRDLRAAVLRRWIDRLAKAVDDPVFAPWLAYASLPAADFSAGAAAVAPARIGPLAAAFAAPPKDLADAARRYGEALAAHAGDAVEDDADGERLRQALRGDGAPTAFPLDQADAVFDGEDRKKLRELARKAEALPVDHPGAPPRAMALADVEKPHENHVARRGNHDDPAEVAPRRFLAALGGPDRPVFAHGSGRLELARAIASADNPLTARVIVNRVWGWHFGAGLVRTPSDFGRRSDPPSHAALLDWLARRFVADGWSLKKLHRLILASSAWQQACANPAVDPARDPDDRLLWRFRRQRLDFESLRDGLLAASGELDPALGGRAVDAAASTRRAVYGFVDRLNPAGVLRAFDVPVGQLHSPQRFETTVPQQALWLMNGAFANERARRLGERAGEGGGDERDRARRLYRLALGRFPDPEELIAGVAFIAAAQRSPPPPPPAWSYGSGRYDEASDRVAEFAPLAHYSEQRWSPSEHHPDAVLGWVELRADGGHPGRDAAHAAIRRWTAPRDGAIEIGGLLAHRQKEGDGVRARVVASGSGRLGAWTAHDGQAATEASATVHAGDTVDFVVDCLGSDGWDSFAWAPDVRYRDGGEWRADSQFAGPPPPPLDPWGRFAQALLLTNEFCFVD